MLASMQRATQQIVCFMTLNQRNSYIKKATLTVKRYKK